MSCGKPCNGSVFVRGVAGVAKAVLGVDRAPDAEVYLRREACRACFHAKKHPILRSDSGLPLVSWCELCKCSLKLKTVVASEACPDGRWKPVGKAKS